MSDLLKSILARGGRIVLLGSRRITRSGADRFHIYLPQALNDLWELLWKGKAKVRVYLELVEE